MPPPQLPRPLEIRVNLPFSLMPTVPTMTMMTTLMRPAISPYSIAVAPEVSAAKRRIKLDMRYLKDGGNSDRCKRADVEQISTYRSVTTTVVNAFSCLRLSPNFLTPRP